MAQQPATADDFLWGDEVGGISLGIRRTSEDQEEGLLSIRAAARNHLSEQVLLEGELGVVLESAEGRMEYFEGPQSAEGLLLEPSSWIEILGRRVSDVPETDFSCWVECRRDSEVEIRSGILEIPVS